MVLAALAVVFAAAGAALSLRQAGPVTPLTAAEVERAFESLDIQRQAAAEIAMERGTVYAALHAAGPAAAALREATDARRARIAALLSRAGERVRLDAGDGADLARLIDVDARLERVRADVDAALAVARSARDPDLAGRWFRAAADVIVSLHEVLAAIHVRIAHAQPGSAPALDLQRRAWQATDAAGRERAFIAAAMSGAQPLGGAALKRLDRHHRRVLQEWAAIERLALATGGAPVRAEVRRARARLLDEYRRARRDGLARAGGRAGAADTADWFSESTETIDSIYSVGTAAGDHAARRSAGRDVR